VTERYGIASLSELQIKTSPESALWSTVRIHFDIGAFGVNAWTAEQDGQTVIGEHDEAGPRGGQHEELYFVSSGHATFTVDGDEIDAPAGTFVFVREPSAKRMAVAKTAGTTVLAVGAVRGKAFVPSQWERSARALRHWGTGDFAQAAAELSEVHERYPEDGGVLYNLACAESMAGRREPALAHLREAIELDPDFRELAEKDSDFDSIRDDPGFPSAVAGQPDSGSSGS
jgi:tetratricopeptide (TPR) repeat protein